MPIAWQVQSVRDALACGLRSNEVCHEFLTGGCGKNCPVGASAPPPAAGILQQMARRSGRTYVECPAQKRLSQNDLPSRAATQVFATPTKRIAKITGSEPVPVFRAASGGRAATGCRNTACEKSARWPKKPLATCDDRAIIEAENGRMYTNFHMEVFRCRDCRAPGNTAAHPVPRPPRNTEGLWTLFRAAAGVNVSRGETPDVASDGLACLSPCRCAAK